jgi:hypothetical protein
MRQNARELKEPPRVTAISSRLHRHCARAVGRTWLNPGWLRDSRLWGQPSRWPPYSGRARVAVS